MFIFSNLAISLDGKIGVRSREHFMLGTKEDVKQMMALRRKCEAIVMGGATLRSFKMPCVIRDDPAPARHPANVVVSRSMEGFDPAWKFFTDARIQRVFFVSEKPSQPVLEKFEGLCEIVPFSNPFDRAPLAAQVTEGLKERGFSRILVEGGGGLMWDFASQNLIDEYNVTVTPRILGGAEAPTLVDGKGFGVKDVLNLKLQSCRQLGDELYLVYSKTEKRGQ